MYAYDIITEDDLLRLGAQDILFEVVDGVMVEMSPTGFEHNFVVANAVDILRPHTRQHQLGYVGGDGLIFVLHTDESGVRLMRIPDVFFLRRDRFQADFDPKRPFYGAPDLAIEVVSPSESEATVFDKITDYFQYGCEQVWVLYPDLEQVRVYRRDDSRVIRLYGPDDVLEEPSFFPGLTIRVTDLFRSPV
jgi:Uma2 family endonuclease